MLFRSEAAKGNGNPKSELRSVKKLYPEKFVPSKDNFKEWSGEFLTWVKAEDEALAEYLKRHQFSKEPIALPSTPHELSDVGFVYSHLKRLMGDSKSKRVVKWTPRDNGGEAWRRLMRKYCPQTQAIKRRRLREVLNYGVRHAQTAVKDVTAVLADYEEFIYKYMFDFEENPVLPVQRGML